MYLSKITLYQEEALSDAMKITFLWESKTTFGNCSPCNQWDFSLVNPVEQLR